MRQALPAVLLVLMLSIPAAHARATAGAAVPTLTLPSWVENTGYWHTSGNRIVDADGRTVRIAAVNWAGMQTNRWVPAGLDRQPLDTLLAMIRSFGFNAIRVPFSNEVVERNPIVTTGLDANPALRGLHALTILDRIVAAAGKHGLRIILENHRSSQGTDPQGNGLWYTPRFPESAWIRDWQVLAARYKGNPTVVGVDLRNEPHTAAPGPWSVKTYLHQGATWGPYNGVDNPRTDWRLAAERGGNAVLKINPHLLIFVEGIEQYPDPTRPGGIDTYWWGSVFQPALHYPIVLDVPHQLVYAPHEYGPDKYRQPFFGPHMNYQELTAVWERHWGFLESPSYAAQAPIFIGEFGTCATSVSCVSSATPGSQGLWFQFLLRYLRAHPEIGWAFWALNGSSPRGADQPNYLLRSDWSGPRLSQLINALRPIEGLPAG